MLNPFMNHFPPWTSLFILTNITMDNFHFSWENPLFLWPYYQRVSPWRCSSSVPPWTPAPPSCRPVSSTRARRPRRRLGRWSWEKSWEKPYGTLGIDWIDHHWKLAHVVRISMGFPWDLRSKLRGLWVSMKQKHHVRCFDGMEDVVKQHDIWIPLGFILQSRGGGKDISF